MVENEVAQCHQNMPKKYPQQFLLSKRFFTRTQQIAKYLGYVSKKISHQDLPKKLNLVTLAVLSLLAVMAMLASSTKLAALISDLWVVRSSSTPTSS